MNYGREKTKRLEVLVQNLSEKLEEKSVEVKELEVELEKYNQRMLLGQVAIISLAVVMTIGLMAQCEMKTHVFQGGGTLIPLEKKN
jgi:predicted RNase H-like nuclease (RuvC/YqgF family)